MPQRSTIFSKRSASVALSMAATNAGTSAAGMLNMKVRVTAQHAGVDRQACPGPADSESLTQHERHVTVGTVAQQAVDLAMAAAGFDAQHGRFRQLVDDLEPRRRA